MDGHQVLDVGGKQQGHLCSRKLVPDKNNGLVKLELCLHLELYYIIEIIHLR